MLYSLDKIINMVNDGEVLHIRLSSWNDDIWARLDSALRGTYKGKPIAMFKGAYKIATDLPMSARLYKKLIGSKAMLRDGTPVTIKYGNVKIAGNWRDSHDNLRHELVYQPCPTIKEKYLQEKKHKEKKMEWLSSNDLSKEITTGFELETQETEGMTGEAPHRDKVNTSLFPIKELKDLLQTNYSNQTTKSIADLDLDKFQQVIDIIGFDSLRLEWPLKYYMPFRSDLLDVDTDTSVDGFEIRTVGGLTEAQFKEAVHTVYSAQHKINTRCSFHIHVGMKNLPASKADIGTMISHIVNHPELPETVRERFADSNANYFLRLDVNGRVKNSFIRVHPQGTLEFRCFGNVQSAEEAMKCREIALSAVKEALLNCNDEGIYNNAWKSQIKAVMEQGIKEERHEDCAV